MRSKPLLKKREPNKRHLIKYFEFNFAQEEYSIDLECKNMRFFLFQFHHSNLHIKNFCSVKIDKGVAHWPQSISIDSNFISHYVSKRKRNKNLRFCGLR